MITVEDSGSDYSYTAYALKGEELGDPVLLDGTRNASTMTDPMFMAGDKAMVAGRICELANGKCQDAPWDANDLTAYQENGSRDTSLLCYSAAFNIRLALWPPKPNEFVMANSVGGRAAPTRRSGGTASETRR